MEGKRNRSGSEQTENDEPLAFRHRDWQYRRPFVVGFSFLQVTCGSDLAREPAASGLSLTTPSAGSHVSANGASVSKMERSVVWLVHKNFLCKSHGYDRDYCVCARGIPWKICLFVEMILD